MRHLLPIMFLMALVIPSFSIIAQDECDNGNYLETRLFSGSYGQVSSGGSSNRVRAEPSTDGEELYQIPPGHIFSIAGWETVCSEGIVWKQVRYLDRVGWTAESYLSVSPDYFIEPLELVQTIDETITLNNGATALAFTPDGTQLTMALPDNSLTWYNLLDNSTGTAALDTVEPILEIVYHPDGSGIYATIHPHSLNIWNSNHDLIRSIESRMLGDYPSVFEMDDEWDVIANGGCLDDTDDGCRKGGIVLIDPETDRDIATFDDQHPDTVRDIEFMSRPFSTPGGYSNYENILISVSEHTRASLELEVGRDWRESYDTRSGASLNAIALTFMDGVAFYGGCNTYSGETCSEGYLEAIAWTSGGRRSNFSTVPAEVIDIILSPIGLEDIERLFALTTEQTVYMIDYSDYYFDIETVITTLDNIPVQAMALSPNGTVFAIASDDTVMIYDTSVVEQ